VLATGCDQDLAGLLPVLPPGGLVSFATLATGATERYPDILFFPDAL
jgi:hypothetical protein